jgi:hypothetical protein
MTPCPLQFISLFLALFMIFGVVRIYRTRQRAAPQTPLPIYAVNDVKWSDGSEVSIYCRMMRPRLGSFCHAYHVDRWNLPDTTLEEHRVGMASEPIET